MNPGKWWGSRQVQPILAIHGWQDNCGTFDKLAPLLTNRGLSLLCIDLPGHGFSSHLPAGQFYYIFWDGLLVVRRIVAHFKWKEISILGHSLGGAIAFLYAASFPNDIKKYISLDIASPSVRDPKRMVRLIGPSTDKFLYYETLTEDKMPCYQYDEMLKIVHEAYAGGVDMEGCRTMLKRGMRKSDKKDDSYVFTRDPRLKLSAHGFFTMDQVLEFASCITCEVMNIRGNPGMKLDFPEYYNLVLDTIEKTAKKMERHVVEGTHHLHLNNPQNVADIIYDFLTS